MRERTSRSLRAAAVTLIAAFLLPSAAHADMHEESQARRTNPAAAAFDVVVLRPLGLAALAIGSALFVPVAVLTAPSGKDGLKPALEIFVAEPARNVFTRPLGDF